jgi:O-glycosyl hydrolase
MHQTRLSFRIQATKGKMVALLFLQQLLFGWLIVSCSSEQIPEPPPNKTAGDAELTINLADEKQVMHSFGASDCWTTKFAGKWSDLNKRNKMADLLFSMDTQPDGSPKGIGLSLWRFNIGAGSYEQGTNSNIGDEWRREECFQNADGSYNWNKHEGQRWFLQAARERGVKYTLGFSISAPVHMTKNGKAFSAGGNAFNIQADKMDDFADFLADVSQQMQFDYLSPANEPQWAWAAYNGEAGQEGTPALNGELSSLAKLLSNKLAAKAISTRIVMAEAAQMDFLYSRNDDGRGDQINQFFSPAAANYIGNLPNVDQTISAHSYFTSCPDDNLIKIRENLRNKIQQVNPSLQVWQTEFGILGDICGKYNGYPRNTGMDYGLYVAKVIHHDLAIANVSSWQWWLAISPYDYSDALVYLKAPNGVINVGNSKTDGIVQDSKQLWVLGNFSRFIRPGMVRVAASLEGKEAPLVAAGSMMVTAYKDPVAKTIAIVMVNTTGDDIKLTLKGITVAGSELQVYATSATKSLARSVAAPDALTIDKKSVTTVIAPYQ